MASENKPRYARIGFTVLLAAVAIAGTLVYLGGFAGKDSYVLVESYYDNPVSGLSAGSAVNFRGVKIGEVRDIMLVGLRPGDVSKTDAQRVRILMAIELKRIGALRGDPGDERVRSVVEAWVARGLRATVTSSGITGLSHIELNMMDNPPAPAALAWRPRHPVIPPAPSLMESFSDAATRVMNQIDKMDFAAVWSNVQVLAESAAGLASNADSLLESRRSEIAEMVDSLRLAADKVGELADRLSANPSLLLRPADREPLPETSAR